MRAVRDGCVTSGFRRNVDSGCGSGILALALASVICSDAGNSVHHKVGCNCGRESYQGR